MVNSMLNDLANALRVIASDMVCSARSGHLGMPLGMADVLTVLFKEHMTFCAKVPNWFNRDRFIMSGGHGSALLYAILHLCGYEKFSLKELEQFRKLGSLATGHPEYNKNAGVEMTTGPLGEGIASAVGFAIAERILNNRLGNECINHFTYVSAGDGDLMEGVAHEACSLAGHLGLGQLIVLFDDNSITIDGDTSITLSEDLSLRFRSYGWHVLSVDGHNYREISKAISEAKSFEDKPSIIFCKTKIGYGSCFESMNKAHACVLDKCQLMQLKRNLHAEYDIHSIPDDIVHEWQAIGSQHNEQCKTWVEKYGNVLENIEQEIISTVENVVKSMKKEFFVNRPFSSTRAISGQILNKICGASKYIVSGSCDLGTSTCCKTSMSKAITRTDFSGNYINYGIREHAMGAIVNGITLHGGLKAIGGTFFAFSDFMRPAIRLSALMNIPSVFVFSHDSIGVGEDGPTHQPIEQLASFRAMPNLNVFRPGDPIETLECWHVILTQQAPSLLILSRQDVKNVRVCGKDNMCSKGAYFLYQNTANSDNRFVLIATGAEIGLACEVHNILEKQHGMSVDLVSMPCWELFELQSDEYKNAIIKPNLFKVVIEAACDFGWHKYIGNNGLFFGVNNFGKSAPYLDLFNYFGLNSNQIVNVILSKLSENACENRD